MQQRLRGRAALAFCLSPDDRQCEDAEHSSKDLVDHSHKFRIGPQCSDHTLGRQYEKSGQDGIEGDKVKAKKKQLATHVGVGGFNKARQEGHEKEHDLGVRQRALTTIRWSKLSRQGTSRAECQG